MNKILKAFTNSKVTERIFTCHAYTVQLPVVENEMCEAGYFLQTLDDINDVKRYIIGSRDLNLRFFNRDDMQEITISAICSTAFACKVVKALREDWINGTYTGEDLINSYRWRVSRTTVKPAYSFGLSGMAVCRAFNVDSEAQLPINWDEVLKNYILENYNPDEERVTFEENQFTVYINRREFYYLKKGKKDVMDIYFTLGF